MSLFNHGFLKDSGYHSQVRHAPYNTDGLILLPQAYKTNQLIVIKTQRMFWECFFFGGGTECLFSIPMVYIQLATCMASNVYPEPVSVAQFNAIYSVTYLTLLDFMSLVIE